MSLILIRGWLTSTASPSCTRISDTMPPSRLCTTCTWLAGITLPLPRITTSISAQFIQAMALATNSVMISTTSITKRGERCTTAAERLCM